MNDWHVSKDSSVTDVETYTLGFTQERTMTMEPYSDQADGGRDGPMDSAWPMLSHDIYHTGRSLYSTELNLGTEIWRIRGHGLGVVWSSPVIDENITIYFGTTSSDSALYAIFTNGIMKWRYQADGRIWCTPTIAEDGTIYFTTWGGYGNMHALYPNGTVKWMFRDGYESSSLSSPTIGNDGTIYFGSDGSRTYAVNPNGTMKWFYNTGNTDSSPTIGSDGTIYVGSENLYSLFALNPNGTLRWQFYIGSKIRGSASIAPDGTIYVPAFNGYFYALYPNGTLKWQAYTGGSIAAAGVALAEDGSIYIGTEQLRAFYPNGTLKWCTNVQGSIYGTVPAISADGTIYVSAGGSLVAVSPDGTERWRKQLTIAQIHSSPSIGPDDRVYVGSEDYGLSAYGYLHAFGPLYPNAPTAPTITGQTNGKIKRTYEYTFTSTSPLENEIYYFIDWGDGTTTDWLGPYNSGETITLNHSWGKKGTYVIKARAKDTDNNWGPWGELEVTMPKNKAMLMNHPILSWLFERFPNAFPILRYLLAVDLHF